MQRSRDHRNLHSFPTRRSSDLEENGRVELEVLVSFLAEAVALVLGHQVPHRHAAPLQGRHHLLGFTARDRKSTRLNSSHTVISYAVFCLKKKNISQLHSS